MHKPLVLALVGVAAAAAALPALAQVPGPRGPVPAEAGVHARDAWRPIDVRRSDLDRRIDQGLRNGRLSRREAVRLRNAFDSLLRLEARYRRGGLTAWERADLDRRFDRLSVEIRHERRDRDDRRGRG